MARIAIGIGVGVAAAAMTVAGGPLAGISAMTAFSVGMSVGTVIGSVIFPDVAPNQVNEGARLTDLKFTTSTYGNVRPVIYGANRQAGNVIWGTPVQEHKIVQESHVGGGFGSEQTITQITYNYTATFAVAFGRGVANGVVRIWADSTLIYDVSSPSNTAVDAQENIYDRELARNITSKPGLNFRFYRGTDDQLPDSLIEADEGVGNVPGHRGEVYIVFDTYPLGDHGNRIPNIEAELAYSAVEDLADYVTLTPASIIPTTPDDTFIATNPLTLRGYVVGYSPFSIKEFNLLTMEIVAERTLGSIMGEVDTIFDGIYDEADWNAFLPSNVRGGMVVGFDRHLYLCFSRFYVRINAVTWATGTNQVVDYGSDLNAGSPISANATGFLVPIGVMGPYGIENYIATGGGNMTAVRITPFFEDPADTVDTDDTPVYACLGRMDYGRGACYVLSRTTSSPPYAELTIHEVYVTVVGRERVDGTTNIDVERGTGTNKLFTILPTDVEGAATGWHAAGHMVYDPSDDSVIFQAVTSNGSPLNTWLIKWARVGGIIWAIQPIPGSTSISSFQATAASDVRFQKYAVMYDDRMLFIDLVDGTIISDVTWGINTLNGSQIYSGAAQALLAPTDADPDTIWTKFPIGRLKHSAVALSTIFADVCDFAGLDVAQYDVTDIASITVNGFAISQQAPAAAILRPLCGVFQIDVIEEDGVITFRRRGGSIVTTITEDDLLRTGSGAEPYAETRVQEADMPTQLSVTYRDQTANYQNNTQVARRSRTPKATVHSDNVSNFQVALVMTAAQAAQAAEKLLYAAALERETFRVTLPPKFVWLRPADPVTLTLNSGYSIRGRLGQVEMGVDFSLDTTVIGEDVGQYSSVAPGADADGTLNFPIWAPMPTQLFLLDTPLLRDLDDTNGIAIRTYFAAAPYADIPWGGAQLQASSDEVLWTPVAVAVNEIPWGMFETALPDADSSFHIRRLETIVVKMVSGGDTLASCTETQMANGSNFMGIFKADGEIELAQFLTVSALGSDRYQLTGFMRGRRGTDTMGLTHLAGEVVVFLGNTTISRFVLPLAAAGRPDYYRAVTAMSMPNLAASERRVLHGRDQMPYAPVQVTADLNAGDIDLAWVRRARINGNWLDGTGAVAIGEVTESYEIDIYNGAGDTVLRTLTSVTDAVTYTAAQITTDFGSPPATLNVSVYQISATVGRGFTRLDALVVT